MLLMISAPGGGGAGGGYTIETALAVLPYTLVPPTAPTITSGPVTVNPSTIAANLVNGRELILEAGDYGSLWIPTTDQRLRFQSSATADDTILQNTSARLELIAEPGAIRSNNLGLLHEQSGATDLYLEGMTATITGDVHHRFDAIRAAHIGCDFSSESYAMYSDLGVDLHLLFGNCRMIGTGGFGDPTYRLISPSYTAFVHGRLEHNGASSVARWHAETAPATNNYMGYSTLVGGSIFIDADANGDAAFDNLLAVWFEQNSWYGDSEQMLTGSGGARPQALHLANNVGYGISAWPSGLPGQTGSGNTIEAFTTAPAWGFS